MQQPFDYFVDRIPDDIYSATKTYISEYIAIFEPEGYVMGEKLHFDDYHFILFFSDSPVTLIDGKEYRFKKGAFRVFLPWNVIEVIPTDAKLGKYVTVSVKRDFFEKITSRISGGKEFKFTAFENNYSKQLLDLIGNFQREMMNCDEAFPVVIESICIQLVCQLIRDINSGISAGKSKINKDNLYISKAIQYMQEYYFTNITIKDICSKIYLSPCHFKRVFKDYTNRTPYQYLVNIRLDKAKEILKKGDYSMEEAARLCGFINPGHFSTVFKRNVGMSPSEYRKIG